MTNVEAAVRGTDRGHLLRVLGVAFGMAVVVGGTIGQGILRTPGLVAQGAATPAMIILLWFLGGVVALIDSMSTVELASSIRETGGSYTFARRAFGSFPSLAVAICDWLANVGGIAFIGVVFAEYLHRLGVATFLPLGILAALLVLATGAIQLLGTKIGGRVQQVGAAIKAGLFILLILALLFAPRGAPAASITTPEAATAMTIGGVIVALRAIFGAYSGWNSCAYFCEEVHNPGSAIARSTFSGVAIVTFIYVMANIAYLSVLSPAEMAGSNLVAADAAARVFGASGDTVVTAVSLVSLATVLNATIMIYPRVAFAVARDFSIPVLNRVAANGTPRAAVIATVVVAALLATAGVYEVLLAFSMSLQVAMQMSVNVAALVVRRREPGLERPWKMPLFPLPALIALAVNTALFFAFVSEAPVTATQAFVLLAVLTGLAWLAARRVMSAARAPKA